MNTLHFASPSCGRRGSIPRVDASDGQSGPALDHAGKDGANKVVPMSLSSSFSPLLSLDTNGSNKTNAEVANANTSAVLDDDYLATSSGKKRESAAISKMTSSSSMMTMKTPTKARTASIMLGTDDKENARVVAFDCARSGTEQKRDHVRTKLHHHHEQLHHHHGRSKSDGQGLLSSEMLDLLGGGEHNRHNSNSNNDNKNTISSCFGGAKDASDISSGTPPPKASGGAATLQYGTPLSASNRKKVKRGRHSYGRGIGTPSFASPFSSIKSAARKSKRRLTPPRPTASGGGGGSAMRHSSSSSSSSAFKSAFESAGKGPTLTTTPTPITTKLSISAISSFDETGSDCRRTDLVSRDRDALRTSEQDPSDFQVELPSLDELRTSAKICAVVGDYLELADAGVGAESSSSSSSLAARDFTFKSLLPGGAHFGDATHPVASKLKEASRGGDIIVQGFFREYYGMEENTVQGGGGGGNRKGGRVEACVFGSQSGRVYVVAFRGSTSVQGRPIKGTMQTRLGVSEEPSLPLHPKDQPDIPIVALFRDAYFAQSLESDLFRHLDQLTALHPFWDVVFTGHSFGAALASIGAVRYGFLRPRIRVSCHTYGCPRVGGMNFRHLAHSLPNLKIVRVENGSDPYVSMPEGGMWEHVGHSIAVDVPRAPLLSNEDHHSHRQQQQQQHHHHHHSRRGSESMPRRSSSLATATDTAVVDVRAYRFDKGRAGGGGHNIFLSGISAISKMANPGHWLLNNVHSSAESDHDMGAYIDKLTKMTGLPQKFVGLEGDGVRGLDDEIRCVV